MSEIQVSKDLVKNFLVNRSFFNRKAASLDEYFDRFWCIQTDPIVYITRSHEISLWNRVMDLRRSDLDTALYKKRTLIEYWQQLYSLIPLKNRPLLSARMRVKGGWQDDFYAEHAEEVEMARSYIIAKGPTTANELKFIPQTKALFEWTSSKSNKATLDYLWDRGEITVSHRDKNKKYYDLTERLLPDEYLTFADEETSLEYFVKSNFAYLGIVRAAIIWKSGRSIRDKIQEKWRSMVEDGTIVALKIEGVKTKYFILADDAEALMGSRDNQHECLTMIPPFDPLITDRKILSDIFNYDYQWQFYWPPAKRTFNPYGMPILYKGSIVGEIGLSKETSYKRIYMTELESSIDDGEFRRLLNSEVAGLEAFVFGM